MGCSSNNEVKKRNIIEDIKAFNEKYKDKDEDNTEIERFSKDIFLHNIEQEGFNSFCNIKFDLLIDLYLNNNNIENIEPFGHFTAPNLKHLDLSFNKIKNINIFKKVNFPLVHLDLSNNVINNIDIFLDEKLFKKLKNIFFTNNDIDFENKKVKNIMTKLKERMILNNEDSNIECDNDENFIIALKNVKTFNLKKNTSFGIYEKGVIIKMRTLENLNKSDESIINEIEKYLSKLKLSVNIFKDNKLENVKVPRTKTIKN